MESSPSRFPRLLVVIGASLVALLLGLQLGMAYERQMAETGAQDIVGSTTGTGQVIGDPEKQVNLSLLWNVWHLLQQNYIAPRELNPRAMVYGAVAGLVQGIGDPYTVFMSPSENQAFQQTLSGQLQGIGAEMALQDGAVTVVSPLKGSPAERAGLKPGDIVDRVNDASVDGMTLSQVVTLIRGPKGTSVTLQILREGNAAPLSIKIPRADISVPSVESKILTTSGGIVGYVALNEFGRNTTQEVRQALANFKGKPLKGIVLDLRFNGGGYLDGAVELCSMFLRQGLIVSVQNRTGDSEKHFADGHPLYPDTPLVVLINQGSASASEITAGALQDLGRATIIGVKSFGKGTVQDVMDLPDGSSLRVTIARWLTPKGRNLGKQGVAPDILIEPGPDDAPGGKDTQLQAAIDWLTLKKNDAKKTKATGSGMTK